MLFQAGVILLYGSVHIFLCFLHYNMGLHDQQRNGEKLKEKQGFGLIKSIILSLTIGATSLAAYVLLLLENKGIPTYFDNPDKEDQDWLVLVKRHSTKQSWIIMLCLVIACIILQLLFARNLLLISSRPVRARGTASRVHSTAFTFSIISMILLGFMI